MHLFTSFTTVTKALCPRHYFSCTHRRDIDRPYLILTLPTIIPSFELALHTLQGTRVPFRRLFIDSHAYQSNALPKMCSCNTSIGLITSPLKRHATTERYADAQSRLFAHDLCYDHLLVVYDNSPHTPSVTIADTFTAFLDVIKLHCPFTIMHDSSCHAVLLPQFFLPSLIFYFFLPLQTFVFNLSSSSGPSLN